MRAASVSCIPLSNTTKRFLPSHFARYIAIRRHAGDRPRDVAPGGGSRRSRSRSQASVHPQRERPFQRGDEPLGDQLGAACTEIFARQDDELIAGEGGQGVHVATTASSRRATDCSSSSPAAWPCVSLIV